MRFVWSSLFLVRLANGMLGKDDVRAMMPVVAAEEDCECYKAIRDECMKRIETVASEGKEYCVYDVSPFNFGLPVYDPDEVFNKLYAELKEKKYQVVSWPALRRIWIAWYENEQVAFENLMNALASVSNSE